MTSRQLIDANIKKWEALAARADLVGKEVELTNGRDSALARGKIKQIRVEDGYFIIESDEILAEYDAHRTGTPNLRFKIDEEREPHQVVGIIFCDLDDDRRQIRIFTLDPVIDWVSKIRPVLKRESDEDVGRAGDTPTSRLADEIANRCGSNPLEAMRVIEALFTLTREVAQQTDNRLFASGRLSFLSQYVLPVGPLINLAVPPMKK